MLKIATLVVNATLWWRHNDHDSVSNHQPHECLFNRLFRPRSKKTSKLRVTGLCVGNSPGPVNSPHKGPVTRKMFPFDDVIMHFAILLVSLQKWIQHISTDIISNKISCWSHASAIYAKMINCHNKKTTVSCHISRVRWPAVNHMFT